jgi:deoxyribodipyrimidine photo-lyase
MNIMKKRLINVFLHRRDLRIVDNRALEKLHSQDPDVQIMHVFIFSPQQVDPTKNTYFNKNCVEFMVQCLHDLDIALNGGLHCFHGEDIDILNKILSIHRVQCLAFNLDYTPFATRRDTLLIQWCLNKGVQCVTEQDYSLLPMGSIENENGRMYEMFTPFYNKCVARAHDIPLSTSSINQPFIDKHHLNTIKNIDQYYGNEPNTRLAVKGGRTNALNILSKIGKGTYKNYGKLRDYPGLSKTTLLSAYMKFGQVSVREVFHHVKKIYGLHHALTRQLFWREFYAHCIHSFPWMLHGQLRNHNENKPFRSKYYDIWASTNKYDETIWEAFTKGKTGYPFVDAGIRQLISTGNCHNRARMVIASFAAKDLMISPWIVERWFATHLVDYDPCSNSGGVQWAYGIGPDPMFVYRSFNPFLQSFKFDNNCKYIKTWVQELNHVNKEDIHTWSISYDKYKSIRYPKPIVDHSQQVKKLKSLIQRLA